VKELKASGNTIMALETVKDSQSLFEKDFSSLDDQGFVCLIFLIYCLSFFLSYFLFSFLFSFETVISLSLKV
jgi:hypothetical protein